MAAVERESRTLEVQFDAARLERVFNACFAVSCRTRLSGGAEEPLYQPATDTGCFHALFYRQDYFASALHEVAHWCIAGEERRQQLDFGYWYAPEGRNVEQQKAFEAVESKPQALEWFFSKACGYPFRVSLDNPELAATDLHMADKFTQEVLYQALMRSRDGLPGRASEFYQALCCEFGTDVPAADLSFSLTELR